MSKPESNCVDSLMNVATIGNTLSAFLLNGIGTGTDRFQRVGKKVAMTSLEVDIWIQTIQPPLVATDYRNDNPHIAIVLDRKPTGVTPTVAELFQDVDRTGSPENVPCSRINLNNRRRFKLLLTWKPTLPGYSQTAAGAFTNLGPGIEATTPTFEKHCFFKFKNKTQTFSGVGSTLGSIEENAIYLVYFGYIPSATSGYNCRFNSRFRYHE